MSSKTHRASDGVRRIWFSDRGRAVLDGLGLRDVDDVSAFDGGETVSAGTKRRVCRLLTEDGDEVYLKISRAAGSRHVLRSLLRTGVRRASSVTEFFNHRRLLARGVSAAEPLAAGQHVSGWRESASFVLTAAAPGCSVDVYLAGSAGDWTRSPANDRLVTDAVCEVAGRLLSAGIEVRDFEPKHVFVRHDGPATLIDMQSVVTWRGAGFKAGCRMLAHFVAALPVGTLTPEIRQRALTALFGARSRRARRRILEAVAELWTDRRHRRFVALGRPSAPAIRWRRADHGRIVVDPDVDSTLAAAGLVGNSADELLERLSRPPEHSTVPFVWEDAPETELRRCFNAYNALQGRIPVRRLVMHVLPADRHGRGVTVRERGSGETFRAACRAAGVAVVRDRLQDGACQALTALLRVGYAPDDDDPERWLEVEDGTVCLVLRPGLAALDVTRQAERQVLQRLLGRLAESGARE